MITFYCYYCWPVGTEIALGNFIEPYYLCTTNGYLTPLDTISELIIIDKSKLAKSNNNTHKNNIKIDIDEINVVVIGTLLTINFASISSNKSVIVRSQKYFIYNNKQCTYGVYTKNSFTCLNYYSCTNLYFSTTPSKCIEYPIEKCVSCLSTGKCIKCETYYLLDSKNTTCTLFHIDNCLISQNKICLKCDEGKLLENGLCVSPKNNCQQFDIDTNCLLCDTTRKLNIKGILCEPVDIKNNSYSQRNIISCVDGYFV
ncbi:hypothetical protein EIN_321430 [Entamoeba invadens IP1]|uniref:Uncharacterized protein n=1 Tax=Entamoeba invadens IP1 TaxID=370355 RepID=A0A0A1UGW1_ENTIV|nr:hypothetical protein EIN_321430 [Entamoeba invadens IP1]ELP93730.1 hypothetical protein EIN_321430 [Entamoeba invadens IP1]|eukprot:XP_004260501.1 hypothetical protein EIN_321430 [Entamoeba invadens IP1]